MKEKLSRTYSSWVTLRAWEHRLMCKKNKLLVVHCTLPLEMIEQEPL